MGSVENKLKSLGEALPNLKLVAPSDDEYVSRRSNPLGRGDDRAPIGFAVPKNAQEVSDVLLWVKASSTDFCVRSGGNDFYGRSLLDGGLVIDMRDIKFVTLSDDKETVTFGGGIISAALVEAVEKEGRVVPFGNTGFVGYAAWATIGGYGPLTNSLGMGFESLVGAELVNPNGEIIQATEEMLEGLRSMGGNLGIVTSLTVKTYPMRKLMAGLIVMEGSETNIRTVAAAAKTFDRSCSVLQHFVMSDMTDPTKLQLSTNFSWYGDDLEKGKEFLASYVKAIPPVKVNMVEEKTATEYINGPPYPSLPFGGVRSAVIDQVDGEVLDILVDALKKKAMAGNMTWAEGYEIDHSKLPKNTFGPGNHTFFTFSDIAPAEALHTEAKEWADSLDAALKKSKAWTSCTYAPLTRPGTRTAKETMGDKYQRAIELKKKYDPENVFRHAVPEMDVE